MALPILSASPAAPNRAMDEIRKKLGGEPAANDPQISRESPAPPAAEKTSKSKVVDIQQARQRREPQKIERVPSSPASNSRQAAQAANERAIERSQSQTNPLIPLLSSMNGTLTSMNGTLKSILVVLKTQSDILSKILAKTDIGDSGDDDGGGWGRNRREKSRRDRARDRHRERRQRQRDRAHPPGRVRRGVRAGMSAGKKGLLGLAGVLGLGDLLPEPVQDAIDVADTAGDIADVARGAPRPTPGIPPTPGTPPGAQGSRLSRVLGSGGKVLSKLAAPLAIGMSLYENSDELLKTGKVDPLKQVEKMGGGLMDIFNPQDTEGDEGGLHIMKRLGGAGDVLSGATGAVLGAGTQVGAAIQDMIPTDISDSIVDGIVGLFGGETNADRAKKQKELDDKQAKEMEERKKIREAEKKAVEEKAKKDAEDKAKQEAEKKVEVPPVVVDAAGKPVPALVPGQTKESSEEIKRAATEESLKPNLPTSVSILQPDGKPIPVVLTDEKGKPLVTSLDQAAANTPGAAPTAPTAQPAVPPATNPPAIQPSAAPGAPAIQPSAAQSPATPPAAQPAVPVSQQTEERRKTASEMLGLPPGLIPTAGAGMAWGLNQQNAIPERYKNTPPTTGARTADTTKARRENPAEYSVAQAQKEAAAQDRAIPPTPAPQNTTTQPAQGAAVGVAGMMASQGVPGAATVAGAIANPPTTPGQRTVAGSYTPSDEDSKYFKGDLSKLKGMDPVFVEKLKAASAEAGVALPLTSGFRSQEKQDQLRADAVKKYGSEAAASKWVAKTSIHTTGNAADFSMGGDAKKFWDSNPKLVEAMEKQGLHRPLSHEAWHWESDVTKGQDRKGLAAKLIEQRDASLKAGTPPQAESTLAQTAQGVAAGVPAVLAAQGVPGAAAVSGAISNIQKGGKSFSADVESAISSAAQQTGVPLSYMRTMANIESSGNASAHRAGSKYTGLYQFDEATAAGVGVQNRNDASQAALGAAKLAQKNIKALAGYGIDVDINKNPELAYLAHQQGAKGASDIIKAAQSGGPVSERLRKTMDANGGKGMTPAQFLEHWKTTYNKKSGQVGHSAEGESSQEAAQPTPAPQVTPTQPSPDAPAMTPAPAQIEPVPASAAASENRKKVSEMLGLPSDALPKAGEGIAWALNQQNAIPEKYRNNPRQTPGERQRTTGTAKARRQNSDSQEELRGLYAKETFTGSVPPPAEIPNTLPIPPELSTAPARDQQNYQLLGQPNVQATIDTLQAGGADLVNNLGTTATNLGVSSLPSPVSSGISTVDQLRKSGAYHPMMSGDLSGVLSKVAPNLTSFPGLQSVFDQSAAGGGGFARQFNSVTGNALRGTGIPMAMGATLSGVGGMGGVAGNALGSLGGAASSLLGGILSPQSQETSGPLESAGFADKQSDRNAAAPQQPSAAPSSGASRVSPERGSTMMKGDQAPLEIRNSESSIRRLTDMLISFSFG